MTPAEFSQRLFQAEPGSPESAALARDLVEDAHYPARHAIDRYLLSGDEAQQTKARIALGEMDEFALLPLAANPHMRQMDAELWSMRTMVSELVAFRKRAASALRGQLGNRRPLKPSPEGSGYRPPAGARVCDLAYILLERMFHTGSDSSAELLALSPARRDERIRQFEKSKIFRSIFETHP